MPISIHSLFIMGTCLFFGLATPCLAEVNCYPMLQATESPPRPKTADSKYLSLFELSSPQEVILQSAEVSTVTAMRNALFSCTEHYPGYVSNWTEWQEIPTVVDWQTDYESYGRLLVYATSPVEGQPASSPIFPSVTASKELNNFLEVTLDGEVVSTRLLDPTGGLATQDKLWFFRLSSG